MQSHSNGDDLGDNRIGMAKTVTMTTIDQSGLSNIRVMVPPLEEQVKFTKIFQAVESNKPKKNTSLKMMNVLIKSITQRTFRK